MLSFPYKVDNTELFSDFKKKKERNHLENYLGELQNSAGSKRLHKTRELRDRGAQCVLC